MSLNSSRTRNGRKKSRYGFRKGKQGRNTFLIACCRLRNHYPYKKLLLDVYDMKILRSAVAAHFHVNFLHEGEKFREIATRRDVVSLKWFVIDIRPLNS